MKHHNIYAPCNDKKHMFLLESLKHNLLPELSAIVHYFIVILNKFRTLSISAYKIYDDKYRLTLQEHFLLYSQSNQEGNLYCSCKIR